MQVRAGHSAGRARQGNHGSSLNFLSSTGGQLGAVRIHGPQIVRVLDHDVVAIGGLITCDDHRPGQRRADRRPLRHRQIHSAVTVRLAADRVDSIAKF